MAGPAPATPSTGQPATPARLHAPRGLRSFLIGAAAASQAMGKLTMLGLPIDLLQESWSPDGATIGEVSVQVVDDASAEPGDALAAAASRLSLTTSAVDAVRELYPLALDDDTGAAVAATYADLMTATLLGHAGTAEFEAAAAGRPLEDLLAEGRQYLAETAATWLTVVLGLVRLRAAQQADADAADYAAELDTIVTAYNQAKAAPAASPFTTYLAEELLANHPSTQPLPDAEASVDGEHFTDALRSAVRHTDAGSPIKEDGGPDHPPDAGPDPGDLGNPILASAAALAGQLQTYTQDPLERWEDDKGDCSSFVQRALFGAGIALFDPGPTHQNVWSTLTFTTRDDVFAAVKPADARPGDVLVQGGYKTVNGVVTWEGHCGIFRRQSPADPDLLEGISMDRHGPTQQGLWGADPPKGHFARAAHLRVRRVRPARAGPAGGPWDTADSVGNFLRYPVAAAPVHEGDLAAVTGGLETETSLHARVSVIVGPGATLRGIATALLPLYTAAAPAVPPTAEHLAQALAFYSRYYLPVPSLTAYRVGLRIPLPIEVDAATGDWVLNSRLVSDWAASFDPAWQPVLDTRPAPLEPADEDGPTLAAADFLGQFDSHLERGIELYARVLTNPFEAVLLAFEIMRLLGDQAFFVALEFFNKTVQHQLSLLATLTAGSGLLRRLERILDDPPGGLTADQEQSLTRAGAMLEEALRPGGVQADARELPETPRQLADRGAIPQDIRPAPQDPAGGLHRMVLGRDVLSGRDGVFNQVHPVHQFRGPLFMGRIEPGTFIARHQAQLNPLGDQRLAERLLIVSAISPNEAALDGIRLRDAGIVSTGVHQWSAAFPTELPAMLWRYRSLAPLEFDLFFRLYGLEVRPDAPDAHGNPQFMLQQIAPNRTDLATFAQKRAFFKGATAAGVTTFDTLWAARFRLASTALSAYGLAQALEAAARFDRILREVGNLNVAGVNQSLDSVISSRHGVALILDQHINEPGSVRADLQAAINAVVPQPNADALDRAATNQFAGIRHLQDAVARTARIVALGLARDHGSFQGW